MNLNDMTSSSLGEYLHCGKVGSTYAICMTYYNEDCKDVRRTLESISRGLNKLRGVNEELRVVVYLIVDGAQPADSSLMSVADEIPKENRFNYNQVSFRRTSYNDSFGNDDNFDIFFAVKDKNRGKLNSHRVFFEEICMRINPGVCMQIDTGTTLTEDCLANLYQTLEDETLSNVGVGAGMCIENKEQKDPLYSFQSGEFLLQRGIYWSAEHFFGYLSVMPGQCSVVRWGALIEKDASGTSPLERYLQPEEEFSPVDKLAYLAEDRVMGLELFSNGGYKNNISYEPNAVAYTDPCDSFEELLKQRRRWINSAFTCRVLMILFFCKQLFEKKVSVQRKLKSLPYIIYASAVCLTELLLPTIFITFSVGAYSLLSSMVPSHLLPYSYFVFWFLHIAALSPLLFSLLGQARKVSKSHINISLISASCMFFLNLFLFYVNSYQVINSEIDTTIFNLFTLSLSLVALPLIITLGVIASSGTTEISWIKRIKYVVSYISTALIMYLTLYVYAICNIKDTSWGTKGLVKDAFRTNHDQQKAVQLAIYQYWFWLAYVSVNATFIVCGFKCVFSQALYLCVFIFGVLHSTGLKRLSYLRPA